ncbi:helix-turn-helix transcriptional regulator [Pleionea sediminis]|uniref:helix-turn-helix transcriptional regulator n=1 Tax=Pleionea sediminis TaxID=2569479 RepID=UPI0011859F3C|nr:helix-turn-helix transcriptional regulator [Pleionea sediminis]
MSAVNLMLDPGELTQGVAIERHQCGNLFHSTHFTLHTNTEVDIDVTSPLTLLLIENGSITVSFESGNRILEVGQSLLLHEAGTLVVKNNHRQSASINRITFSFDMISRFNERYGSVVSRYSKNKEALAYILAQKNDLIVFPECDLTRMAFHTLNVFSAYEDNALYALKLEELLLLKLTGGKGHLLAFILLGACDPAKERFRKFVEQNVLNDWSLAQYAKEYGLSLTAFKLTFLKVFGGTSPKAWINDKRLRHADIQLRTTQKKIIDIAIEAGFSSQSYFTQSYKAKYGCSPSEARSQR